MTLRSKLRSLVPQWAMNAHARYLSRRMDRELGELPVRQIFERTYLEHRWGTNSTSDLYSGRGSHADEIVGPYVEAVRRFISALRQSPVVVDLGCGDFNVGRQICDLCRTYTACDIVGAVIEQNRRKYSSLPVTFRVLDIIDEPLPPGDIACLRQVLQHLSNDQIARIVPKLAQYRYLILTEHLPRKPVFRPNVEKPPGPGARLAMGSGVVLTEPPFSLAPLSQQRICTVEQGGGVIQTTVYTSS